MPLVSTRTKNTINSTRRPRQPPVRCVAGKMSGTTMRTDCGVCGPNSAAHLARWMAAGRVPRATPRWARQTGLRAAFQIVPRVFQDLRAGPFFQRGLKAVGLADQHLVFCQPRSCRNLSSAAPRRSLIRLRIDLFDERIRHSRPRKDFIDDHAEMCRRHTWDRIASTPRAKVGTRL